MRSAFLFFLVAPVLVVGCSPSTSSTDAAGSGEDAGLSDGALPDAFAPDAPLVDGGPADAGPPLVMGFVIDDPGPLPTPPSGSAYTLLTAASGGSGGGTLGSPCTTAGDCSALGPHAACMHADAGGFCTIDCDLDPEGPSQLCPSGAYCFTRLRDDGGRLCLPSCESDTDCPSGMHCGGPLGQFNVVPIAQRACLPSCATDADCNATTSGLRCDTARHTCVTPRSALGAACTTSDDCLGLDPGARCMRSTRDPSRSYCTVLCDPAESVCTLGDVVGSCVTGYASDASGAVLSVCLGACSAESECQLASVNTCNYFPTLARALCTIACTTDADCVHGTCDAASGDCRETSAWSSACASDSSCPGPSAICVADFHHQDLRNCTRRCFGDGDCAAGDVCVTGPNAEDGAGARLAYMTGTGPDEGFCAPTCTPGTTPCPDGSTCLQPMTMPEIDFSGSGAASHAFCWH